MSLEIDKYKHRSTRYNNAVDVHYDNRRITVLKEEDGGFKFALKRMLKSFDDVECIRKQSITVQRDKILLTQFALSKEAAEVLMVALADLFGYTVMDEK